MHLAPQWASPVRDRPLNTSVIVVEDDAGMAAMIRTVLESAPEVATEIFSDEGSAQSRIKRDPPMLIILDMTLPYSRRLLDALKHDTATRFVPVVALGSWQTPTEAGDRNWAVDPGVDVILHTPFDVEELLAIVAHHVPRKRESGA